MAMHSLTWVHASKVLVNAMRVAWGTSFNIVRAETMPPLQSKALFQNRCYQRAT